MSRLRYVLVGEQRPTRLAGTVVLLALGVGAITMSATELREGLRLAPAELTCAQWLDAPLERRWVALSGCRMDLAAATSRSWRGWFPASDGGPRGPRTLELFLPVWATETRDVLPRAVVATSDAELLGVIDELARVPPAEVDGFIEAHRRTLESKLMPARLVGYVEPVASLASRSALKTMMVERAVVLQEGRAPARANAAFGVLVGLVLLAVALVPMFARFRASQEEAD